MCLICVEFQKQKMSLREAKAALSEMSVGLGSAHAREVREMLDEAEDEADTNPGIKTKRP